MIKKIFIGIFTVSCLIYSSYAQDFIQNEKKEIVQKRTQTSKLFINNNNTATLIATAGIPMHYLVNGELEDINTEVKTNINKNAIDYPFAVTKNSVKTYFSNKYEQGIRLSFEKENLFILKHISLSNKLNSKSEIISGNLDNVNVKSNNYIVANVFESIDFVYKQGNNGFKTGYIIKEKNAISNLINSGSEILFSETITLPEGWTIKTTNSREYTKYRKLITGISIFDNNNIERLKYHQPKYFDNKKEKRNTLYGNYKISKNDSDVTISIVVPSSWFEKNALTYPVVIDPAVEYNPQNAANWTGRVYSDDVKVGGTIRTGSWDASTTVSGWAKFDISEINDNVTITNVQLKLYENSDYAAQLVVDIVALSNDPVDRSGTNLFSDISSGSVYATESTYDDGVAWYTTDLGTTADSDVESALSDDWFAIGLKPTSWDNNDDYVNFHGYSDANAPILEVTFTVPACATISYPNNGATEITTEPIIIWEKVDEADGYKVYLGTDNPPTNIENGTTTKSTGYYVSSALTTNTLHYIKIVPYNEAGDASSCSAISFTTIDPTNYTSWTGATSSDWSVSGNWDNGVPDDTKSIIIPVVDPGDNQPTISSNASVNNVTLETGGVLNVSDGVTFSIYGEWNNYFGTLRGNTAILEFKGAGTGLSAYSTPAYEIDGLETSGSATLDPLTGSGDYRGGIAVTKDYLYVTGDAGTVRMSSSDLTGLTTMTDERNGLFSDLLTGKLYTLWDTNTSSDPECKCDDNATGAADSEDCLETFNFNAIRELNADLSTSSTIIPLVDIDGNSTSIECKGGQKYITATSTTWTYRTGIFPGYGFLLIFADNESGDERMYSIDIQSGEVDSLGSKNITPELEVSEGYANWGFGEFDGDDFYCIYKMKDSEKLRRVNLTTMVTTDYIDFSGTDGLGYMSSITFSPWNSRWYYYVEGPTEFDNTVAAGDEVAGYAEGANKITINKGLPEVLTNVIINKTASTDVLTLSSPLTLRDLTITQGDLDVSTSNHTLSMKGDLSIAANGTLTNRDANIQFTGLSDQSVAGSSLSFYNSTIDKATGVLTLSNNLTVTNQLNLTNGIISTGSNTLSITSSVAAAISGGSSNSFVYGNLKRSIASNTDTYAFYIGDGTASTDYYRFDFNNNNLAGVTDLLTKVSGITESGNNIDANITANEGAGNGYSNVLGDAIWEITPTGTASGGSYGVNLYFGDLSSELADNFFGVLKRNSGSTTYADWDSFSGSTTKPADDAIGRTVAGEYSQRTGFTSFSEFAVGETSFSLPIELVNFYGKYIEQGIKLFWTTASEINNDKYYIERSFDGLNFHVFATVSGAGNSSKIIDYNYLDTTRFHTPVYYKLKQVDYDGSHSYSDIISFNRKVNRFEDVNIYINQASNELCISSNNEISISKVSIYDYTGKLLYAKVLPSDNFIKNSNIEIPSLNIGLYLISLKSTNGLQTIKYVVF